jgi:Uma2 family endonuclease
MSVGAVNPRFFPRHGAVPSLEAGDELTRDEFERRYDATPGLKKAELIEGVVHMPPPAVRWDYHASPHADLVTWLGYYRSATLGVQAGDNASIRLDLKNEPQPDAALVILPEYGGRVKKSSDGYLEGAPDLVAEVSASTESIDLNAKLRVYKRNGVREYLVWRVRDQAIDWFELRDRDYKPLSLDPEGVVRSTVFPGLWLHCPAMLRGDVAAVLQVLQRGVATPEHASFVTKLAAARLPEQS